MLYGYRNDARYSSTEVCLNPYFFGKCSTAGSLVSKKQNLRQSLNPYFFGKCSTAHAYL